MSSLWPHVIHREVMIQCNTTMWAISCVTIRLIKSFSFAASHKHCRFMQLYVDVI